MAGQTELKNICVYGIGGVGGYFGGKIAHRISNDNGSSYQVCFIARGQQMNEIAQNGLILNTQEQTDMICRPSKITDNIKDLPPIDIFLICVKSYDLDQVTRQIALYMNKTTVLIPLLNGVDIYERIRDSLDDGIVLPSCLYVTAHIERPGVVTQAGVEGRIILGKDPKYPDLIPQNVLDLFNCTGINVEWMDDPNPAIWEKYIFVSAFGLVTAHSGKTLGEVVNDPELREHARKIMSEVVTIANRVGISLAGDIIDQSVIKARSFPFDTKTSYQRDVERGNRNEGDLFGGTIIRLGNRHEVATNTTSRLYSEIQERLEE